MVRVILVEPDGPLRQRSVRWLAARGRAMETCAAPPEDLDPTAPVLFLLGPGAAEGDPVALLRELEEGGERWARLVLVEPGDVETAAEATSRGAEAVLETDAGPARLAGHVETLCRQVEAAERSAGASEVRQRYAELESLVYLISHDLKTPVVSIQGIATILLEQDPGADRREEYIRRLQANAERIEALVRDLLEFPKVGRLVGLPERVAMDEVVDRALDTLAQQIEETGAEIEVEEGLPEVMGDRKRIQQVLHNLLDNAIRYGGEPARIRIGYRAENGAASFFVRDRGEGISEDDLEKAFHLFRRLESGKKRRNGMGIGLAISRRIIEGHGGRLWADSRPGEGTTFWFRLPRPEGTGPGDSAEDSEDPPALEG